MGNLHIVTGYRGSAHVTAADTGSLNVTLFGTGQKVLNRGNKFSASVISNNQIRVLDGDIIMQGRHIRLNEGTYVDLTIDNGASGMLRNDLIVARYTKNSSTGVEDCNLVVIKGTAVSSNPADPEYTSGDIIEDHDLQNDMPLYRIPLSGLNVGELVCLFDTIEDDLISLSQKQPNTNSLTASTDIANDDYFPFYDTSLNANRKTLWSNIIAKIRTALFGNTNGILKANGSGTVSAATIDSTPTSGSANLVSSGGVFSALSGKQATKKTITVSLAAGSWSNKAQTVAATNVTASNVVIVSPAPASHLAYSEAQVRCTAQAANSLTFTCETVPSSALSVNVVIFN